MRTRTARLVALLGLGVSALAVISLTHGQDRSPSAVRQPPGPVAGAPATPAPESGKLAPLQQQMLLSVQRGADWLRRANQSDGRFAPGYVPALKAPLEGDHFLRQAGAAFALARAARFLNDERYLAVARQAVLTLLLETAPDPQDPQVRYTPLPSVLVNRLGAAGLLVLAINELPSPGDDILAQSEQLCAYIRKQQQPDGSLSYTDTPTAAAGAAADPEGMNHYPGQALYGLLLSQRHRPAPWKLDVARKALAYYRGWWRGHRDTSLAAWQSAAFAEAYLQTKEPAFAEAVVEMTDWLCTRQHTQLDPRHPLWLGGFTEGPEDRPATGGPRTSSATAAQGLAAACRVARQTGDVARYTRYREALERCLQFTTTLQYTEANTQHFADWYQPVLVGGFHASHQDGTLRLDYTQHAVCALVEYLSLGAD